MIQGDSYCIPITITMGGTPVTPAEVAGIKFKMGERIYLYPYPEEYYEHPEEHKEKELAYDEELQKWFIAFPQSVSLVTNKVYAQVQVRFLEGEIFNSPKQMVTVNSGIIKEEW